LTNITHDVEEREIPKQQVVKALFFNENMQIFFGEKRQYWPVDIRCTNN